MYGNPDHSTLRSTFASVIKAGSIMDLWNGIAPRMFRIVCAAFILNYVKTTSVDYLEDSRKK
jgi:solute carrier family 25 citrate transporter 1